MKREAIYELIQRIPPLDHSKTVLVTRTGFGISVDIFYRLEEEFLVVRGRESGTNDDNRAFFVPFDEIAYMKIDRVMKVNDLRKMYGDALVTDFEETMADAAAASVPGNAPGSAATPVPAVSPSAPVDPADIAKQNLLDRIRAARTSSGAPRK